MVDSRKTTLVTTAMPSRGLVISLIIHFVLTWLQDGGARPQLIASAYSTVTRTGSVSAPEKTKIDSRDEKSRDTSSKTAHSYLQDSNDSLNSNLNYDHSIRKKTEMVSNTRDNHDEARRGSVDSKYEYPVLYLPHNHKLTPSDLQYYQHPVYVAEERPTELSYHKSEMFPNEIKHFTTNQPVGTHLYDIVTELKQTTNPRTPISQKDDPYNLDTLSTNTYKFDAALDESFLKVLKHDRRQGHSESQDSKESNISSQNKSHKVSNNPSDDLYKNSAYYVPLSNHSELALILSQDSQTKDSYDGPDSYNPPAIINSYGTPFEQSGDMYPPLDMYDTLKPPAQNKSHTYTLDIYSFPSLVNSHQSQSFPATYKPPSIIQTYKPPSLVDTYKTPLLADNYKPVKIYKNPSPEDSYGPPSLTEVLLPPQPVDTDQSVSMETYKSQSPEDSYGPPSLTTIYKPPSSVNVNNLSLPTNTHNLPSSVDDYKTTPPSERDKLPLVMETYKPIKHINVYKVPSSMEISNLSPPPPPPMKPNKTLPPADENKPPLHDDKFKPPIMNYPQSNASFDKSPPYNDERPLKAIQKFPPFKGPHKQHMSSDTTITDSYAMPLSEDQPQHNGSSEDGLSDDDGYPQYDTQEHDSHNYGTYDSTKDHISHDDSHGPDHDHIYNHEPKGYYYHHQSYNYEDHETPGAHPPTKDHYHHSPLDEYEGEVPHDHYRDHIYHRDPKEHYSHHHLHDYDDHELPVVHQPTKYNYPYPSPYVYTEGTSPPEEPSPSKEMVGDLTPPSNGMVGSSTPSANNMVESATSPPPDMTQSPPPPTKDMVEVPDHDSHNYGTYDNTKDHISHDDSHGPDHDHIYNHEPKGYYYHHQSYNYEDHEIPGAHPPTKDHYHHPPLDEYEGEVPHDHYRDHIYHRDPKEHYSHHHLHDYDDHELPVVHRPTIYNYPYPSPYVYTVGNSPPEEPSPFKEMVGDLTPPSNGMVGSSTPPANNMVEPATSPSPDMTQSPPPPKDMVQVPPPPPNDMYGASPHLPLDMYMNHLHHVEGMYGVHPPIYVYGTPTTTTSASIMTEAPPTSTTPMEKKPLSRYYYLGRKLWLVPVYGTAILLVQMLYLLLKAIARHKVVTPFNFFTKLRGRNLESQRQQELDSNTQHVTEALETAEYRYV